MSLERLTGWPFCETCLYWSHYVSTYCHATFFTTFGFFISYFYVVWDVSSACQQFWFLSQSLSFCEIYLCTLHLFSQLLCRPNTGISETSPTKLSTTHSTIYKTVIIKLCPVSPKQFDWGLYSEFTWFYSWLDSRFSSHFSYIISVPLGKQVTMFCSLLSFPYLLILFSKLCVDIYVYVNVTIIVS